METEYNLTPGINRNYEFAPEVRQKISEALELQNRYVRMLNGVLVIGDTPVFGTPTPTDPVDPEVPVDPEEPEEPPVVTIPGMVTKEQMDAAIEAAVAPLRDAITNLERVVYGDGGADLLRDPSMPDSFFVLNANSDALMPDPEYPNDFFVLTETADFELDPDMPDAFFVIGE